MKKLTLLVSAMTAGLFASANADVSVSGSSVVAYQSADSNNNMVTGGAVSFGLSTTTDSGMTVSSGAGITLSASDTSTPAKAISGFNNITFATGGVSITVGDDVGLPDGVGDVGGVVSDITALNNNGMLKTVGITDDEGAGMSLTSGFGGATVSLYYVANSANTTANNTDIDGATGTGSGIKISTTVGDFGVTAAYVAHQDTSIDDTETGIAVTYATGGGTLTVGYENSTGAKDGNQFGANYSWAVSDATTLKLGYSSADVDSKSGSQIDVAISQSLGGGVSVFGEMRSVSGDTGTDTSSTSNSTMAIGTSVSF